VKAWPFKKNWKECSLFPTSMSSPALQLQENIALSKVANKHLHSVFCEFILILNIVVSYHHAIAMKRCLGDDETERQLKCKLCDLELCFLVCFKEYHTKVRFRYWMRGLNLCIHQADNNKKYIFIEYYAVQK
jgi:hypothetical protein